MLEQSTKSLSTENSDPYYKALKAFQLDPNQDFTRLASRLGIEAANHYAHLYFSAQKRFERFRREIELHSGEQNDLTNEYEALLVMPSPRLMPNGVIQSVLRPSQAMATSAGFRSVVQARLNSSNALEGARRLHRMLRDRIEQGRKVVLISYSFGSAFVRIALDQMENSQIDQLGGWINMAGLIYGSQRFHQSNRNTLFRRAALEQRSFAADQTYFLKPFSSRGLKTIHLLPIPLAETMPTRERRFRDAIKAFGPNDGLVSLAKYQNIDGFVMSFLGQRHGLDMGVVGGRFVPMLSSLLSVVPVRKQQPVSWENRLNFQ